MQLLYANDGINYRTISKSLSLSSKAEKVLLESYLKYDFVSHSEAYSSICNEPEMITYVVSNLNNELSNNCLVMAKAGHMSNFTTPSYYFHALIEKVDDDFFKEDFFTIFNYQFINDRDVNNYNQYNIDNYKFSAEYLNTVTLNNDQLITILATFMDNEKNNKKTKIIVDAKGDRYNQRAREILASIYHYLPYELRKRHGFITYTKESECESGRVSFVLYAIDELKTVTNSYIKLDEINMAALATNVANKYIDYAVYLVSELNEAGRKAHFAKLSSIAKNGRLKIDDCITYFSNLKKWQDGTQEKLLPEWISYVDQNSFRKGPLYELMVEIILPKVNNEYYNEYLFEKNLNLYNEDIGCLSSKTIKAIRFADHLDNLTIDKKRFNDWYIKQLANKTKGISKTDPQDIIRYKKIIDNEIIILENVDIGSLQLKTILEKNINDLKDILNKINNDLERFENEELERIGIEFAKLQKSSLTEFRTRVLDLKDSIVFSKNTDIFTFNIEEWLNNYLHEEIILETELAKLEHFIMEIKDDLGNKTVEEFKAIIKSRQAAIKTRIFKVTNNNDVLNCYRMIQEISSKEILKPEDEIEVTIGLTTNLMTVAACKSILEFILVPAPVTPIIKDNLEILYNLKLLSVQHFKYLIKASDESNIKRIIDYYFKAFSPIEISGLYVAAILEEYVPEGVKEIIEYYKDDTNEEIQLFVNSFKNIGEKTIKVRKKSFGSFFK